MLITFIKSFAGRKAGRTENMPDRTAELLVRKGYAERQKTAPENTEQKVVNQRGRKPKAQ